MILLTVRSDARDKSSCISITSPDDPTIRNYGSEAAKNSYRIFVANRLRPKLTKTHDAPINEINGSGLAVFGNSFAVELLF